MSEHNPRIVHYKNDKGKLSRVDVCKIRCTNGSKIYQYGDKFYYPNMVEMPISEAKLLFSSIMDERKNPRATKELKAIFAKHDPEGETEPVVPVAAVKKTGSTGSTPKGKVSDATVQKDSHSGV